MPLLLRTELRLRVGPQHSEGGLWRAGLSARCAAQAEASGPPVSALPQLLDVLQGGGRALPRRASACVADELLYFATLPADGARDDSVARARAHFAAMLGDTELLVATHLTPCGRTWLASAIEAAVVDDLNQALAGHDVALRHVRAALFEDLWLLRAGLPANDGLVVMVRREGAMLVGLRTGAISHIAWERCDVADAGALLARVTGHCERMRHPVGAVSEPAACPVYLVPADAEQQRRVAPLAAAQGWHVVARTAVADHA